MNLALDHSTPSLAPVAPRGVAKQRDGEQAIWRALGTGTPDATAIDKRLDDIQNRLAFVRRMKRDDKFKFLRVVLDTEDTRLIAAALPAIELLAMRPVPTVTEEQRVWLGCFNSGSPEKDTQRAMVIDLLVAAGFHPQTIPLFSIIGRGDVATLERALAVGANPNQIRDGETPLITVARAVLQDELCTQLADLLMAAGAIPLVTDGAGRRPSDVARSAGTMGASRYLKSVEDRMQLAFAAGLVEPKVELGIADHAAATTGEERPEGRRRRM